MPAMVSGPETLLQGDDAIGRIFARHLAEGVVGPVWAAELLPA